MHKKVDKDRLWNTKKPVRKTDKQEPKSAFKRQTIEIRERRTCLNRIGYRYNTRIYINIPVSKAINIYK